MSTLKILVVEDEIIIADDICDTLEELGYEVLEPAISYTEALERLEEEQPDFALLDIQLAGRRDGIDLAWKIVDEYKIPFIFLTSNADAATLERAKKVNPSAYLLKPFNKNDLYTSIEIALYNYSTGNQAEVQEGRKEAPQQEAFLKEGSFFIKTSQQYIKVKLQDIAYLQSEHVYVKLFLLDGSSHLIRVGLTKFLATLPDYFFKIHRSYAINMHHIDSIGFVQVKIQGKELPFGKGYRAALLEKVNVL